MRRPSPLALVLLAALATSACDEKKSEPSSRPASFYDSRAPRGGGGSAQKTLQSAYTTGDAAGAATLEDAFTGASMLFDGSMERTGDVIAASATPARDYSNGIVEGTKVVQFTPVREEGGDGDGPPLPDFDGDFGDRPEADDDDGAGPTLLGFAAFQLEQKFPSIAPIMSRLGWGAVKRRGTATAHTPYRVTVHHTQSQRPMTEAETAKIVKNIQSYHMKGRAKSGLDNFDDIGYHFLIAGDGRVIEGRKAEVLGAHAKGANDGNIGISVMGDFNKMKPTGEQTESLTRLITYLSLKYRKDPIAKGFLEPHQRYDPTDCPGVHLLEILDGLRVRVDQRAGTVVADGSFKPLTVIGG